MGLKLLKQLKFEALKKQFPSMPEYAIPQTTYSDKTANGLEKAIVEFLQLSGHQAERVKNTGRYLKTKGPKDEIFQRNFDSGKYIPGTGTNGTADISSTIRVNINGNSFGLTVKWEVKIGKDIQSDSQKRYQSHIESTGGKYFVVKTFDDFFEKYTDLINQF